MERKIMGKGKLLSLGLGLALVLASGPAVAGGSAAKGEKLFKMRCKSCHSVVPNKHMIGPSLAGVYQRKAGTTNFKKYKGLKGSKFVWTAENLDKYLQNPKKFLGKKTAMVVKIKKPNDRTDIITYLKTLK